MKKVFFMVLNDMRVSNLTEFSFLGEITI